MTMVREATYWREISRRKGYLSAYDVGGI